MESSRLQLKKAPGHDGISNEMLRQLGPVARGALLDIINRSWRSAEVPRQWRQATVVPIPKPGKDKSHVTSYRPIALTSHVAKLTECLIKGCLAFLSESRGLVPPEQAGFRAGRSVEDSLGRLIQEVQDGWHGIVLRRGGETHRRAQRHRSTSWWRTTSPVPMTWWTTGYSDCDSSSWD